MRQRNGELAEAEGEASGGTAPGVGTSGHATPAEPLRALRACKGAVAALCVGTALIHMVLVFLYVAPSNPISERFEQPMNVWVRPFFQQGWGLFAPNPGGVNTQIFARTGWVTASGERQVSDWFDISATDRAGVTHQPYPSRTAQRMLRSAWSQYRKTHDGDDEPRSDQAAVWAKCLRNIAVQRVTPLSPHPFQAIRLWVVTQPVRPSSADKRVEPDPKDRGTRLLPWWNVTPDGN